MFMMEKPSKPRWLHVVSHTDPRYGGLSAAVPSLAAALGEQQSVAVSLAAFCHEGEEFRPTMLADHVSFWPTSRTQWVMNRDLKANFVEALREADGLHIHGIWEESTAVACRLARRLEKPYVLSAHGMLEPWALGAKKLKKQVYAALIERDNVAGAACLHALTAAEAEQYRRFGLPAPLRSCLTRWTCPLTPMRSCFWTGFPHLRGKRLVLFHVTAAPQEGP